MIKKILVAEDDKFYSKLYQAKLVKEGFKVVMVDDGGEVMAALKKDPPDLLILDLIMPNMDGFSVLKRIKEDSALKNIHIIVMSNLSQQKDIDEVKRMGADEYYVKSGISINDLVDKIRKIK